MLCSVCIDEINSGDDLKCLVCKELLHFTCAGIREESFRKLSAVNKKQFACSKCKTSGNGTTKPEAEKKFIGSNVTNLATLVQFMRNKFDDFGVQL